MGRTSVWGEDDFSFQSAYLNLGESDFPTCFANYKCSLQDKRACIAGITYDVPFVLQAISYYETVPTHCEWIETAHDGHIRSRVIN